MFYWSHDQEAPHCPCRCLPRRRRGSRGGPGCSCCPEVDPGGYRAARAGAPDPRRAHHPVALDEQDHWVHLVDEGHRQGLRREGLPGRVRSAGLDRRHGGRPGYHHLGYRREVRRNSNRQCDRHEPGRNGRGTPEAHDHRDEEAVAATTRISLASVTHEPGMPVDDAHIREARDLVNNHALALIVIDGSIE